MNYISTDDLPVEVWIKLVTSGLGSCTLYVKTTHPDSGIKKDRMGKIDLVTNTIVEMQTKNAPFFVRKLASDFDCSIAAVRKAIKNAKDILDIRSTYRYSKKSGLFVRKSVLKNRNRKNSSRFKGLGRK